MCIFPVILWVAQRSLEHCVASRGPACVELHINAPIGIGKKKTNKHQAVIYLFTCICVFVYVCTELQMFAKILKENTNTFRGILLAYGCLHVH